MKTTDQFLNLKYFSATLQKKKYKIEWWGIIFLKIVCEFDKIFIFRYFFYSGQCIAIQINKSN